MERYNYTLIIPHHNIPHLLRRLLRTVPVRSDLQVIVVDDCSSEDCQKDLAKIYDEFPHIEHYTTDTNGGGGKARNVGMAYALGHYLLFADADDFFTLCFPDVLDEYVGETADEIFFAANSVDTVTFQNKNRGLGATQNVNRALNNNSPDSLRHKLTAPWAKMIRRQLVVDNNINFQESVVYNDMHFCQMVDYYAVTIKADKRAIYCATAREGSTSDVTTFEREVAKSQVMADYYVFARSHDIYTHEPIGFIGYATDTVRQHSWTDRLEEIYQPWLAIGFSKGKIKRMYRKYRLFQDILIPLNNVRKLIMKPKTQIGGGEN